MLYSDKTSQSALHSLLNDYHLLTYESLDSTNDEAKRIAHGGGAHGAVIWAKRQTEGRGRAGRPWISEAGNLFVSMLIHPPEGAGLLSQLSFVAAVAACDTVKGIIPNADQVKLKWPNDILVNGHKIGGILLESFQTKGEALPWVVVGVGINVDSFPTDVHFPATSLKAEGVELISAKIVLARLIHCFIERYNQWARKGFTPIRKSWLEVAYGLKNEVRVSLPQEEVHGLFKGLDDDGGLIVETGPRKNRTVHAGDVFIFTE